MSEELVEADRSGESRWLFGAAAALILHTSWLLARLPLRYTHEDLAALAAVADDLAHGRLYQIDFPGQFYGSSLEAFPAAPLIWLGFSPRIAMVLSLALLFVGQWLTLGWAIRRRFGAWFAVVVVLVPVVLATRYTASSLLWATAAPRALATVAVAVALGVERRRQRWALVVALFGTALLFDWSMAIIAGPTLVWMAWHDRRSLPLPAIAAGVVPVVALYALRARHHGANPAYDLHPAPSTGFSTESLDWHVDHPTAAFRTYGPEFLIDYRMQAIGAFVVVGAVLVAASWRRDLASRGAAIGVAGGVAAFFASEGSIRAWVTNSEIVSIARGLMGLPIAIIALAAFSPLLSARLDTRRVAAIMAVAAALSTVARVGTDSIGDYEDAFAVDRALSIWSVDDLDQVCAIAADQVDVAPLLASASTLAYGCSTALGHPVLFPEYERRTWLLARHWRDDPATWIVLTPPGGECVGVEVACESVGPGVAIVHATGGGVATAAVDANLPLRPLPEGWPDS
ncbi:MAG: hypothetical protein AAGA37_03900 [Actinomycetota bacterium]